MPYCDRVDGECQNKQNIILDTNTLIKFLQYLSGREGHSDYYHVLTDFKEFIETVSGLCSNGCIHSSERVLNIEYKGTLLRKVRFLNRLSASYKRNFTSIVESRLC